mmetsp:Transcript_2575/g.3828  ORF Transcript_2575/g.3828 Transcript_2575/m.3828 type:complete len:244 (+) Transcript_2575:63-794(+)
MEIDEIGTPILKYGTDIYGKEILELSSKNRNSPYIGTNSIVMMEWEKDYMKQLVNALTIDSGSIVLEIGWGCGYSGTEIQEKNPKMHVIIECSSTVLKRAHKWAESRPSVKIIEGYWQNILASDILASYNFDRVFFDDFPLSTPGSTNYQSTKKSRWEKFVNATLPFLSRTAIITGYMARPIYIDALGYDINQNITLCDVKVPSNCPYFPYEKACVPRIMLTKAKDSHGLRLTKKKKTSANSQ